jgi:hypothetical protein
LPTGQSKNPTDIECGTCGQTKPITEFRGKERNGAIPLGEEFKVPYQDCRECWEGKAAATALIREHLWQGQTPPSPFPNDPRPWSMAREITVWSRLVRLGHDPEEINGAIAHIRGILTNHEGVPLRLTTIYNAAGYATPIFERARAAWINAQQAEAFGPHGSIKLPPTIREVLRRMADG